MNFLTTELTHFMTPPYDDTRLDSEHTASPLPNQSVDEALHEIDRIADRLDLNKS